MSGCVKGGVRECEMVCKGGVRECVIGHVFPLDLDGLSDFYL